VKLLITGSCGFIGSSVGRLAAHAGYEVLGLARASRPREGWLGGHRQVDLENSSLSGIIAEFKPDVVLHAAGSASVSASLASPHDDLRAATLTWGNLLESVRGSRLRPLIFFPSSAAVYGNPAELPVREDAPTLPISPYGFHKAACELLAREYAQCFDLRIVVCRLFSLFGAAQQRLLIWELYQQFASDAPTVWLRGTGKESRDYLHLDDFASAFFQLIDGPSAEAGAPGCRVVNVASGQETNVLDLAKIIGELVAPDKQISCRGVVSPGDPRAWRADINKLRSLVPQWKPQPLSESLAQCISAWKNQNNWQAG
jgi:UDP-glucose 4-epimerase